MDEITLQLEFESEGESKGYKLEGIRDSAVYAKGSESGHVPGLYYLISWKSYPEEENTWEPALAVKHFRKLISTFHKDHSEKPTAISPSVDLTRLMARPKVRPEPPNNKQKCDRPAKASSTGKRSKKN